MARKEDDKTVHEAEHDAAVDNDEQPLLTHLLALRSSVLKSVVAVVIAFIPLYWFANDIYLFVAAPLKAQFPDQSTMIATEVASPFLTPLKLSILAAFFVVVPYVLHQVWRFVAPGLYLREKRFAVPLILSSVVLFYLGMAFAYFVVFPLVFRFFAATIPSDVTWMTDINAYFSFVVKMLFAFGVSFEIPVATVIAVLAGLTTPQSLGRKRPYIIVGCFFIGMVLTPPDLVSQILLAVPCWALFEVGILLSRMISRDREES